MTNNERMTLVKRLKNEGKPYKDIAVILNAQGDGTPSRGNPWRPMVLSKWAVDNGFRIRAPKGYKKSGMKKGATSVVRHHPRMMTKQSPFTPYDKKPQDAATAPDTKNYAYYQDRDNAQRDLLGMASEVLTSNLRTQTKKDALIIIVDAMR